MPSKKNCLRTDTLYLCIVKTMYVENLHRVSGVILDEVVQFSRCLAEVHVILFHKTRKSFKLKEKVFIYTLPLKFSSKTITQVFFTLVSYFLLIPLIIWIILRYKINIVRADDLFKTRVLAVIASKITRRSIVIFVAGSIEEEFYILDRLWKYQNIRNGRDQQKILMY